MSSIEEYSNIFDTYVGQGVRRLSWDVGINPDLNENKAKTHNIVNRLVKRHEKDLQRMQESLPDERLLVKSVNLNKKGKSKQNTVLEEIDFLSWMHGGWEDSLIRRYLGGTTFLFMVFGENENGDVFFLGAMTWKMPISDVEGLRPYWAEVTDILREGVVFKQERQKNKTINRNNLPGQAANSMIHIRPKANDKNHVTLLPDGQTITKQGLWLNASFVTKIVSPLYDLHVDDLRDMRDMVPRDHEIEEKVFADLKRILDEDAYTPESFVKACRSVVPGFGIEDINGAMVEDLGYKIASPYILNKKYGDSRHYIEHVVLGGDYFRMEDTPILTHPYAERMMTKMRDGWRLIELQEGFFITEKLLARAGLTMAMMERYRDAVFEKMVVGKFYNIQRMMALVEGHQIDEYGFDDSFYEGVLRRPGKIAHLRIGQRILFIKGMIQDMRRHLVESLMEGDRVVRIDDIEERFASTYGGAIGTSDLISLVVRVGYHFDSDLEMVFESKQSCLEFIYSKEVRSQS
ncbi:hypothetical protein EVJ29_13350 [Exiguobacterium sp. SH4S7]|uniref:hypothetical protein n=1 Tax=Exiguobacterium sp. SH4S7 TaxID=2510958 RepID=UPI001040B495|nr:hypothetical protein [Exiguobacterium sp. SH4S7]TCI33868.1 hypothetical protein EVJ29_13350 [Exiguobacterium sp. SH4S7]